MDRLMKRTTPLMQSNYLTRDTHTNKKKKERKKGLVN